MNKKRANKKEKKEFFVLYIKLTSLMIGRNWLLVRLNETIP